MLKFLEKHHRVIFYSSWFIFTLIQANFTELQDDEAYYWVYSKFPAWGYFDHPPMIAFIIKTGYFFLKNEVGVRIVPVILNLLTIFIIEKLTLRKNPLLFYSICFSLGVLQIGGFMAVPDIPLVFFASLIFFQYHAYIEKPSWSNALLTGLLTSLMLYSKYHGFLIILFILLSNIRLFRDIKIYVAGMLALVLFLPHLIWQYHHNWVTFRFHLLERSQNDYHISYTMDYLASQFLIAGPLAGFILWPAFFAYRCQNPMERALKFTAIGILSFFFLSTFKGRVEANWTIPALIPLIVLGHQYILTKNNWRKWFYRLFPISFMVVMIFRIMTIVNIFPIHIIVQRYFAWHSWPDELKIKTKGLPVVFNNNYQRASKYWFYTGTQAYSLNSFNDRQNNYNFWPIEDSLLGKAVYILDIFNADSFPDRIHTPLWDVGFGYDSSFYSFVKVKIHTWYSQLVADKNQVLTIPVRSEMPLYYFHFLQKHPEINEPVELAIFHGNDFIKNVRSNITIQDFIKNPEQLVKIDPGIGKGEYFILFVVPSHEYIITRNSETLKLKIP